MRVAILRANLKATFVHAKLPTARRKFRLQSAVDRKKLNKAEFLRRRGLSLTAKGKYSTATSVFRRALRLDSNLDASDPLLLASVLNDFGVLCKYRGRFAEAKRMYLRAMMLVVRGDGGSNHEEFVATLYHNLAGITHAQGRNAEGLKHARRGVQARKRIRPRDAISLAADQTACAAILADMGRNSEAERIYLGALRTFRRRLGDQHYEVGFTLTNLGALYWRMGRARAGEDSLRRGIAILENALGRNHPRIAVAVSNLAFICAQRGSPA